MPTGINPERLKGIPLPKAALALTPLTIGVLSACSNNPALAKLPEGVTPIATDTATAIIPMTPAHAPSIIPASPAITVEVSPLPPSKATETITTTVPVITPTVGTPLPLSGTPFAVPSATVTETVNPTVTVTKSVVPTATNEAPVAPTKSPEEIRKEAKTIADQLTSGPNAVVPADLDAGRRQIIHDAIEQAVVNAPIGATANQINNFIKLRTGRDIRQEFDAQYSRYGITYDDMIAAANLHTRADLFGSIFYIGPSPNSKSNVTYWQNDGIHLGVYEFQNTKTANIHLISSLVKEAIANHINDKVVDIVHARASMRKSTPSTIGQSYIGEDLSFAFLAFMINQHPNLAWPGGTVDELISFALKDKIVQ